MSIIFKQYGDLEYLACEEIAVPHAFTTRLGGVSQAPLDSLNLTLRQGDSPENIRENYRRLGAVLGFSHADLVLTRQTHSDIVRVVSRQDCLGCFHREYPECDALITREPGLALTVFTADCTPILLWDPETGAVGAVHAGWRGTAKDLAGKTVRAMVSHFGCNPKNIRAAIGPNIGPCCFETDADVPHAMLAAYGEDAMPFIHRNHHKYYVNLKALNALSLREAGVWKISVSSLCTACDSRHFWSHRRDGDLRGSQGAIILCQ